MVRRYQALYDETLAEAAAPARRRAVKRALGGAYRLARPLLRVAAPVRALCLCYHRVLAELGCADPWLAVGADTFRRQMEALSRRYALVTAGELCRALRSGPPRRALCAVTFDDGYADSLEQAAPTLAGVGAPATIYLITAALDGGGALWFERVATAVGETARRPGGEARARAAAAELLEGAEVLPSGAGPIALARAVVGALKRLPTPLRRSRAAEVEQALGLDPTRLPRYLTWHEAAQLANSGWEIGAHTHTHPILPLTPDAEARDEIARPRAEIEAHLGIRAAGFAYPNGDHDDRIARLVAEAGYDHAFAAALERRSSAHRPPRRQRAHLARPGRPLRRIVVPRRHRGRLRSPAVMHGDKRPLRGRDC
jgi:peptidoglycan/xylan/chitin deacetylase (PgdA/CDA1 family)